MTQILKLALICSALALAACSPTAFQREAGDMDTGDFGNATMQNTLIATGKIQPPMGNDKYDPPNASGTLNGKYAAVIWEGYTVGATSQHVGSTLLGSEAQAGGDSGGGAGN